MGDRKDIDPGVEYIRNMWQKAFDADNAFYNSIVSKKDIKSGYEYSAQTKEWTWDDEIETNRPMPMPYGLAPGDEGSATQFVKEKGAYLSSQLIQIFDKASPCLVYILEYHWLNNLFYGYRLTIKQHGHEHTFAPIKYTDDVISFLGAVKKKLSKFDGKCHNEKGKPYKQINGEFYAAENMAITNPKFNAIIKDLAIPNLSSHKSKMGGKRKK